MGASVGTVLGADQWEHPYTECSSKGTCDRSSGVCECFDGYDGAACRRMKCDEDCNGHGTCESMYDISTGAYTGWDADKIQKCVCDPGYGGDKCEQRSCKKGDDPITLTVAGSASFQVNEEQTLTFSTATTGEFTLQYKDWRSRTWETWGLDVATITAGAVEEALEALPNSAIPDITVSGSVDGSGNGVLTITFDSAANAGDQNMLVVGIAGCDAVGCQPTYSGATGIAVAESTGGTEEWSVCSNRGTCDTDSGLCLCYPGFSGERCDIQTVIV